jgi:hypothetical protein
MGGARIRKHSAVSGVIAFQLHSASHLEVDNTEVAESSYSTCNFWPIPKSTMRLCDHMECILRVFCAHCFDFVSVFFFSFRVS